jgi:hypothetical protein
MRWPLAVSLVIVLVAGALWYVKLRERADAATVQDHIALKYPGSTIGCNELKANGSLWGCAVVYPAESICLAVGVSYSGHISPGTVNASRCVLPELRRMLPDGPDPDAVAADVTRIVGGDGQFTCAKEPNSTAHWACARPTAAGTQCMVVRVAPWTPMRPNDGGDRCSKLPALRAKVPFT